MYTTFKAAKNGVLYATYSCVHDPIPSTYLYDSKFRNCVYSYNVFGMYTSCVRTFINSLVRILYLMTSVVLLVLQYSMCSIHIANLIVYSNYSMHVTFMQ